MLKRKFFYAVFSLFILASGFSYGQKNNITAADMEQLRQQEDTLVVLADSMLSSGIPDNRGDYCVRFTRHLRTAMDITGSFEYPFDRLAQKIHVIYPDDKSFRIFNWMVAPTTTLRRYYGAIQLPSAEARYYPLKDYSMELDNEAETTTLTNEKWYGCEYYKILSQSIQGRKAYLLFGFNANGLSSNKKLLDVLTFDTGGPLFGTAVFMMPDAKGQRLVPKNRLILEYKKSAQVFLNYDDNRKMIMFNRLASEINDPNRKNTYAPTGQTDGLRLENGQYIFVRDAIPVLKLQDGQAPIDGVMQGG